MPDWNSDTMTIQSAATLECHVTDTGNDIPPQHSIHRPVVMLSTDVTYHTESNHYRLGYDPTKK